MSRTCWMVLGISFSAVGFLSGQATISAPNAGNPKFDWLYAKSIPPEARQQLLPLYLRQDALLNELNSVKWQAAQDTAGGLYSAAAGIARAANGKASATLVEESAARARQTDAEFRGTNAALAAQRGVPAEMFPSVRRAGDIIIEVHDLDKRIASLQRQYSIETIRPATVRPQELTTEAVIKMLTPAAQEAAKPVQTAPWTVSGPAISTPVLPGGVISGADFDPSKLSPEGRAGRETNQAIIRNETLGASGSQQSPAAGKEGGVNFKPGQTYQRVEGLDKDLKRLAEEAAKAGKPEAKKQ